MLRLSCQNKFDIQSRHELTPLCSSDSRFHLRDKIISAESKDHVVVVAVVSQLFLSVNHLHTKHHKYRAQALKYTVSVCWGNRVALPPSQATFDSEN